MFYLFNPCKIFTGLSCADNLPTLCCLGMHAVYHPILCYLSNRMLLTINMLTIKCMTLTFPSHSVTAGETPRQRTEATQSLLWLRGNVVWRFVEKAECQGHSVTRLQPCLHVFWETVTWFPEKHWYALDMNSDQAFQLLMMGGLQFVARPWLCILDYWDMSEHLKLRVPSGDKDVTQAFVWQMSVSL